MANVRPATPAQMQAADAGGDGLSAADRWRTLPQSVLGSLIEAR
ncbi:hypothetical protein XHC_1379 [Xanthomonas hortorum pv. carotae str. M081]|nr:hypothetical protein XHC_1379 [Xanthomonas hortorum pv. carotae str. M081]